MNYADLLQAQPPTIPGEDQRPVWGLIMADLENGRYALPNDNERKLDLNTLFYGRWEFGRSKYGVDLPVDSGRNSRVDELQEALDGLAHSRQTYEQEHRLAEMLRRAGSRAYGGHEHRARSAWTRHLRCLQTVLELLEELGIQSYPAPHKPCTNPDKMHGACDNFGGSDFP